MTEPMSASTFMWFITFAVGGVSALWFIYDSVNLSRALKLDRSDPTVRDRRFGYAMGVLMGTIGVIGALKFHGVV
ncbi:MAG TPA: hypothetical protein VH143_09640 [Kofleriaceae bacterium]|jgi:hypothetical protein|nr:hypothetical protein [Kofleriaceae bacterium]